MSGCNTAAGDKLGAEALSGLARAFFMLAHGPYSARTGPFTPTPPCNCWIKPSPNCVRTKLSGDPKRFAAMVDLMDDPRRDDNSHPSIWDPSPSPERVGAQSGNQRMTTS